MAYFERPWELMERDQLRDSEKVNGLKLRPRFRVGEQVLGEQGGWIDKGIGYEVPGEGMRTCYGQTGLERFHKFSHEYGLRTCRYQWYPSKF